MPKQAPLFMLLTLPAVALSVMAAENGNSEQVLFSEQPWYQNRAGEETVFRGKLEAVPNAAGPSILQRTAFYRLGQRTIHTRAQRVPALDRLVGRQVEFRGKAVDMQLEGQAVREIWPAAVRLAASATKSDDQIPLVDEIVGVTPLPLGRMPGFHRTKPIVVDSDAELSELFGKSAAAKIGKQVDLRRQFLVFFQWAGSGQDRLTHEEETKDEKSIVVFSFRPGRTRDLRPHAHLFAIHKGSEWQVAE